MCGRFALSAPAENIRRHFSLSGEVKVRPRFNIAPGQMINVVRESLPKQYELVPMLWGLVPHWARDRKSGYRLINARAETLEEKNSFRKSFERFRCLIPADGFYEWKKNSGQKKKQPYFIYLNKRELFGFAGLWSSWSDPVSGEKLKSCTIITTEPNPLLSEIHDRMPVIIQPRHYATWLGRQSPSTDVKRMLVPFDQELMECYPVSDLCNRLDNDSPDCIAQL